MTTNWGIDLSIASKLLLTSFEYSTFVGSFFFAMSQETPNGTSKSARAFLFCQDFKGRQQNRDPYHLVGSSCYKGPPPDF